MFERLLVDLASRLGAASIPYMVIGGQAVLPHDPSLFITETRVLPLLHRGSGIRVDMIFSFGEYERAALLRTKPVQLEGGVVQFVSVEDLVIHKIVAGRPRDLEDVLGVLTRTPGLDESYLENWLRQLGGALERDLLRDFREVRKG